MNITITAATTGEWMPAFLQIDSCFTDGSIPLKVQFHQSGVGMLASTYAITKLVLEEKPDLLVQVGIAGSFNTNLPLGSVVVIANEMLGDTGVEEMGKWKDVFDLKLEKSSYHPFEKRQLPNPWLQQYNVLQLPQCNAITVNEISTRPERIKQLVKKYHPQLESMEGAALHYVCREAKIPFLQIRAISNYVGERNKQQWEMAKAINQLTHNLLQFINLLHQQQSVVI